MQQRSKIDDFGIIFRFLTPMLIGVLGYISIQYLSSISKKFDSIDLKFDSFLISYHMIDKRLDKLEYKVLGEKDGDFK